MSADSKSENKKHRNVKGFSFLNSHFAFIFVLLFAGIAGLFIFRANAAHPASSVVTLSLSSTSAHINVGDTFGVDIWINSNNKQINAVQADISYPSDKLEFVSIDTTASNFDVVTPGNRTTGAVSVAMGSTVALNSPSIYVGKVNFKAAGSGRKVPLSLNSTSQVLSYDSSTNILEKMIGQKLTIQ